MGLTTLVGTYDALYLLTLLDKTTVLSFLPEHIVSTSPIFQPSNVIARTLGIEVPETSHPVVFELGRQLSTGVWMFPKSTFQEAKLEIPFLHHPNIPKQSAAAATPFTFKQTIIFDSSFMSFASQHVVGLRSRAATFTPSNSPTQYSLAGSGSSKRIQYDVENALKAAFTYRIDGADKGEGAGEEAVKSVLSQSWFGEASGANATKFKFDFSSPSAAAHRVGQSPMKPIIGSLSINLPYFQIKESQNADEWLTIDNVHGFHITWPFSSDGPQKV